MNLFTRFLLPLLLLAVGQEVRAVSPAWVYFGTNHTLVYSNDVSGNHLIDYSYAGYEGGGVALPTNLVVKTNLTALAGDNTAAIQNAINYVSGLGAGTNGIRGEVLLGAGTYTIGGTLSIGTSGVILSGVGTNTVLSFTNQAATGTAINISGSGGVVEIGSTPLTITDGYVPLGATNFHVSSTSGLGVGTNIVVRRPWTTNWINAMGMSNLWTVSGHDNDAERTITAISGTQVTVNIPLPTPIEQMWCTGQVFPFTDSGRAQQCAVQNLTMVSTWGLATTGDTNGFAWTGINFGNTKNCWVSGIAFSGFGVAVNTAPYLQAKAITVQDCTYSNGINNGSARPAAFQIEGQLCLFQRLTGISGFEHMLATGDEATGPNVFLNCPATGSDFDGGPHRFWAVSLLTDNESGTVGNVHIVIITGGDNGWGAGDSVFYNCDTGNHTIQCPAVTNTYNWWIGGAGANTDPATDPGIYDHDGTTVTPHSLYLEQLKERLGGAAVENIGYPLFTLAGAPATLTTVAGTNAVLTVTVGDPTLMSNAVVLGVTGLPAGAGASWSTNAVTGTGSATLTVTASNSVVPGSYALNLTGTSAGVTHTSTVTLFIGSFSLAASPVAATVLAGNGTNFTVTVATNGGFSGTVSLGLGGLPAGAGGTFNPVSLATNGTSVLSLTTPSNAPAGAYPLTIYGTNGGTVFSTAVTLIITNAAVNPGVMVWTNGAGDLNWSSALNWTNLTAGGGGPPGMSNNVVFTNWSFAGAAGVADNVVNGNYTVGSLTYENTNGFHTTQIAAGKTLTVTGNGGLLMGTESDLGGTASLYASITGAGGTLVVSNPAASLVVRQGSASSGSGLKATLDLSGLDNFSASLSGVVLGALGGLARPCGYLYLAKTNVIIAAGASPAIILGGQGGTAGGNAGSGSILYLGETNAIYANGISVATVKQAGCAVLFNPAVTNSSPVAWFRAADGVSPVPVWQIANSGSSGGTVNTSGTNDFSGGTVNALVNDLAIASSSTGGGTGNPTGALTFGAGLMSLGTLQIGVQGASGANYATATVNVNGPGELAVGTNLWLAQVAGGTGATNTTGTLNVNGGLVVATNIAGGGGVAVINLNSGTVNLQGGGLTGIASLGIGANGAGGSALLENAAVLVVSNPIVIAGNGTLAGDTLITSPGLAVNGTLTPGTGSGVGAITNSGYVTLGAGGNLVLTVQNAAAGPGAGWDFLQAAGTLGVLAAGTNPFTIHPQSYNPDNSGLVTNFNDNTNYSWGVVTAAGGITNFAANKFAVDSSLFGNDLAGGYFYVRTNGSSLVLAFTNNHPPAAGTAFFYRMGGTMAIPVSALTNTWSDPDGDPVVLAGVTGSTNGAGTGTDGDYIYYTNASGGADAILYTVADVRTNPPAVYRAGDTQRTAAGTIVLLPPPVIGGIAVSGGNLILQGTGGIAGGTCYLLASTNLALPLGQWQVVATNAFDGGGGLNLTNAMGAGPARFFLLQMP